ncbi:MAG TPA: DMT family transporter [Ghiorsea sp.]|nr:DMT family transporter [Ghiorsea sp.]HIP07301.1 DMT family transporter [Mariprofundaceae bacterium]
MKLILLTTLALIAFAANSVLCRLALEQDSMDAVSFTIIRLLSGAIMLLIVLRFQSHDETKPASPSWWASVLLFVYAAAFSYAYVLLDTGTGALILFGAVQITMILYTVLSGHRLPLLAWLGLALALFGFVYLMLPDVSAPSWQGFILMAISGVAWGFYTLSGQQSLSPLRDTTLNFIRTIPLALILLLFVMPDIRMDVESVVYAVLSGALASGLGYTLWYMALRGLETSQAAVLQLLVPLIAAGGGLFIAEPISLRLMIASALILGGVLLVLLQRPQT